MIKFNTIEPDLVPGFPLIGEKRKCHIKGKSCEAEILDESNDRYKVNIKDLETGDILYENIWLPSEKIIGVKKI